MLRPLTLLFLLASAHAVSVEGVTFPDRIATGGHDLAVRGSGTLVYRLFFTVYASALSLPAAEKNALADVPRRLEFHYFYAITGSEFVTATEKTIGNHLDAAGLARVRPAIDQLNRLYRDVKPGDRYTLTYLPGSGTELALNGVALGTVPGAEFARALFAIWLGERPLDAGLRKALLGGR